MSEVDDTGRLYMSSFSASLGNWAREDKPREGHDGSQVMIPTGFGVGSSRGSAEEHPVETDKGRYAKAGPHWMLHFHRYQPLALGCMMLSGLQDARERSLPDHHCLPQFVSGIPEILCIKSGHEQLVFLARTPIRKYSGVETGQQCRKVPFTNTNSQADSGLNNHCSVSDLEADYLLVEPKLETCRLLTTR